MHPKAFSSLLRSVIAVGNLLEPWPSGAEPKLENMWSSSRGFFQFSRENIGQYQSLIAEILKHADWSEKFSPEFVGKKIREILEVVQSSTEDQTAQLLQTFMADLDGFDQVHSVYIPLVGIELRDRENWELPGGIVLHRGSQAFLQRFCEEGVFTVEYIRKNSTATVWAELRVTAEPQRAVITTEQVLQRFIDVFRFWGACFQESSRPVAVSIEGEMTTGSRLRFVGDKESKSIGSQPSRDRTLPVVPIDENTLAIVKADGLYCLLESAATIHQSSPFMKLVFRALHVFGRAKTSPRGEDRVLGYTVVLESFLSAADGPISQRVAEGTVVFLNRSLDERIRLRRELLRLYKLRSKIAHGDELESLLPADVWLLEDLTKEFLRAMIFNRHMFQSKHGLLELLERRRLT